MEDEEEQTPEQGVIEEAAETAQEAAETIEASAEVQQEAAEVAVDRAQDAASAATAAAGAAIDAVAAKEQLEAELRQIAERNMAERETRLALLEKEAREWQTERTMILERLSALEANNISTSAPLTLEEQTVLEAAAIEAEMTPPPSVEADPERMEAPEPPPVRAAPARRKGRWL